MIRSKRRLRTRQAKVNRTPRGNLWGYSWNGRWFVSPRDRAKITGMHFQICDDVVTSSSDGGE